MFKKLKNLKILIFLIYFVIPVILVKQKPPIIARFKTTRCSSSNKTFNANITCSVKAYDRYVAKLTVLVNFDVATYQALVRIFGYKDNFGVFHENFGAFGENFEVFWKILEFFLKNSELF